MSTGVIVGYDGSDCARSALATAVEVAAAYGDPLIVAFGYEVNPVGGNVSEYVDSLRQLATERLTEARGIVDGAVATLEVETVIVERAPAEGLAALAQERDARVIVVGTRGEGPFHAALIGSTPHKLLALADRPVLVVPETPTP